MLDEREGEVAPAELDHAFNRKSVWKRIAIVIAGPLANLLLCVMLFWAMFVIGRPDYAPVVGQVGGIADTAGLPQGDPILKVGDRPTPTWTEVQLAPIPAALDPADLDLHLRSAAGTELTHELHIAELPPGYTYACHIKET